MMRASTRRALTSADVLINVPLKQYGSLDWRRAAALIDEGYRAAEAMRDQLLPLAVSEAEFDAIFSRIQAEGIPYGSEPPALTNRAINHRGGGRGALGSRIRRGRGREAQCAVRRRR